jgi:hypothetical protein
MATTTTSATFALPRDPITKITGKPTCAAVTNLRKELCEKALRIDSDASHLSESKARSQAAGCHCLGSHPDKLQGKPPPFNGSVNVLCSIMREIVSSAAEAELGALFHNGKEACSIQTTLEETGHPQPPTPIETDNSAAAGTANDSTKQKRSKAMDTCFCWTRDRARQGQFHIAWHKGAFNKADCFSKHHPAAHRCDLRSTRLHEPPSRNSNCFDCLHDDGDDDNSDAIATSDDSASAALHAQPKAMHSSAAPAGEGVLIPPHAGHASHATCACALSRTLEQTCEAAALLCSFSAAHPL